MAKQKPVIAKIPMNEIMASEVREALAKHRRIILPDHVTEILVDLTPPEEPDEKEEKKK